MGTLEDERELNRFVAKRAVGGQDAMLEAAEWSTRQARLHAEHVARGGTISLKAWLSLNREYEARQPKTLAASNDDPIKNPYPKPLGTLDASDDDFDKPSLTPKGKP